MHENDILCQYTLSIITSSSHTFWSWRLALISKLHKVRPNDVVIERVYCGSRQIAQTFVKYYINRIYFKIVPNSLQTSDKNIRVSDFDGPGILAYCNTALIGMSSWNTITNRCISLFYKEMSFMIMEALRYFTFRQRRQDVILLDVNWVLKRSWNEKKREWENRKKK